MKDIIVLTKDKSLFELIFCELSPLGYSVGELGGRDCYLLFADADDRTVLGAIGSVKHKRLVYISRRPEGVVGEVLARPISMPELRTAVRAAFSKKAESEKAVDGAEKLVLEPEEHAAKIGELRVPLSKNEFLILSALIDAGGRAVGRKALEDAIGSSSAGELEVYICRLRRKLERGGRRLILTERGVGYKLIM